MDQGVSVFVKFIDQTYLKFGSITNWVCGSSLKRVKRVCLCSINLVTLGFAIKFRSLHCSKTSCQIKIFKTSITLSPNYLIWKEHIINFHISSLIYIINTRWTWFRLIMSELNRIRVKFGTFYLGWLLFIGLTPVELSSDIGLNWSDWQQFGWIRIRVDVGPVKSDIRFYLVEWIAVFIR